MCSGDMEQYYILSGLTVSRLIGWLEDKLHEGIVSDARLVSLNARQPKFLMNVVPFHISYFGLHQ